MMNYLNKTKNIKYMNRNRQIRLTEQELHFIVENAVNNILMENMEDESAKDIYNGIKGVGRRFF